MVMKWTMEQNLETDSLMSWKKKKRFFSLDVSTSKKILMSRGLLPLEVFQYFEIGSETKKWNQTDRQIVFK